jgi:hypothetical protein
VNDPATVETVPVAGAGESVLVVDGRGQRARARPVWFGCDRVVIAHRLAFALAYGVEALD